MKQFVCLVCAIGLLLTSRGQMPSIGLSMQKTCSLIFPLPVRHVDRGSAAILVEPVPNAENILFLKAAEPDFSETNLSVVTEDGSLYSFTVCYDPAPAILIFQVPLQGRASLATDARMILDNPPLLHGISRQSWGVRLHVAGIYVRDRTLLIQLVLSNETALPYETGYLRFALRNQKQGRRTAIQEQDLQPLLTSGRYHTVAAGQQTTFVVALPLVTLSGQQFLSVEIGERSGGRNVQLRLSNKHLLHARPLPDLQ